MTELPASSDSLSVFINGGTAPLGRALVRQLVAAGHRVTATAFGSGEGGMLRHDGALPAYPSLTRAGELRSAIMAAKSTIVVNVAPTYPYQAPQCATEWDKYTSIVREGTEAALEAAHAAGVEFFIQGSFSFLGGDEHDHSDHETLEAPFIDAASEAEDFVSESGLAACILRYGFIYSHESSALRDLHKALLQGRSLVLGSEHARANWIHADDAAEATALAIAARPAGETLYVVDDQPTTPVAFVETFAHLIGATMPGQPPFLARGLFAGATQLAMLEQPSGASNAETKAQLGWTPHYPTLTAGLEQALMSWRAEEPIKA